MTHHGKGDTGVIPISEMAKIDGVDFFKGMIDGTYPAPPISGVFPLVPKEVEAGKIVFTSTPSAEFYNPIGSVHGGYAMTLLDTAMACAVHSMLKAGQGYTSVEAKVTFHRPITVKTGEITAKGEVLTMGKRIGTSTGKLFDENDNLLASGTTTCLIFNI